MEVKQFAIYMNTKIKKADNDIEKTKTKIAELQALLPELERKKMELENAEIVRLVRNNANVELEHLNDFLESLKERKLT